MCVGGGWEEERDYFSPLSHSLHAQYSLMTPSFSWFSGSAGTLCLPLWFHVAGCFEYFLFLFPASAKEFCFAVPVRLT